MAMISAICPICNTKKDIEASIVCENCGWIHVFFVQKMPEEVKIFLKKKQDIFKNKSATLQEAIKASDNLISMNVDLGKNLAQLETEYKTIQAKSDSTEQILNELKGNEIINFDANEFEEKIDKVKLQIINLEKYSRELSNQSTIAKDTILCRLEGNKLIVIPPIGKRNFEIPGLAIGFSKKNKIFLIDEADVIIITEKVTVDSVSKREFNIKIDLPLFEFKSNIIALFQFSEKVKIKENI
jgi:hypothetical protein